MFFTNTRRASRGTVSVEQVILWVLYLLVFGAVVSGILYVVGKFT